MDDRVPRESLVAVPVADYLWFIDLALADMGGILRQLGSELANQRPDLAGANSPYAIVTHCLGVMEFWGGATVAGRSIERDRDAEFISSGPVDELVARLDSARRRLEADMVALDPLAAPAPFDKSDDQSVLYATSKGAVLLHILEELFQHLGQLEITRDLLVDERKP